MIVAAIIAEYNPFHNGHEYHISQTRLEGATHIVAIMSGNFVQRGVPAILDKRIRTKMALESGVDLVVELPLPYAMSTARRFAFGAVSIAEGLGCVNRLSFGSESGYLQLLQAAAQAVDSSWVRERTKQIMLSGVTFAKARQDAVCEFYGDEIGSMIASPNDSLGVEYLRQLNLRKSNIVPLVVQRHAVGHDEHAIVNGFASATQIRKMWLEDGVESIANIIPKNGYNTLLKSTSTDLIDFEKFSMLMLPTLRKLKIEELAKLPDISEGLENRIYNAIRQASFTEEVYTLSKSKRYTAARIRRVVMSAFLGLENKMGINQPPYIRILGFNDKGREVLSAAKNTSLLPISDSLAYLSKLDDQCEQMAQLEASSVDLFNLALPVVVPCGYDYIANSIRLI